MFFFDVIKKICPEFKPVICMRYVDDTFQLFCSKHLIKKLWNYINREHKSINQIRFLILSSDNKTFATSIYLKLTFSRVFTNFGSFFPKSSKCNFLFTLLYRPLKLCSYSQLFHQEIDKLKTIFENNYPKGFIDFCIKYLDKGFVKNELVLKASKNS